MQIRPKQRRYRLKNSRRFTAALMILLLCIAAIYLISGGFHLKANTPSQTQVSTSKPTSGPTLDPTPTPAATSTPTPSPTPAAGKADSDLIVVVDPGHGGRDPGTVSPYSDGFFEKDITLDMGLMLREKLEEAGIKVVMTREVDEELDSYWKEDVWARPRIANEVKAAFFVSIHVNSIDKATNNWDSYNGAEIYHYGKKHGEYTSKQFAQMMGEEIDLVTDTKFNGVVKADLGVLRLSDMPALLVETAYITNKEDHKRLESDQFREAMVEGILKGTIRILETMGAYKEDGVFRLSSGQ